MREPEVHQQDPAALLAHHVAGLDVAVDEPGGVDRARRPADVHPDQSGLPRAKGALPGHQFLERRSLHEVGPEPDPSVVLVHAEDRDDVRVSDPGQRPRLGEQRARVVLAVQAARQEQLQRDVALERRVEGAVDLAERPASHALHALERPPVLQRQGHGDFGRRRLELGFSNPPLPVLTSTSRGPALWQGSILTRIAAPGRAWRRRVAAGAVGLDLARHAHAKEQTASPTSRWPRCPGPTGACSVPGSPRRSTAPHGPSAFPTPRSVPPADRGRAGSPPTGRSRSG